MKEKAAVATTELRERCRAAGLSFTHQRLVEHGLLREVSVHHGSLRLENNLEPHHHLVCTQCKAIEDLSEDDFEPIRLKKSLPKGFSVHRFTVEVLGLCRKCAAANRH